MDAAAVAIKADYQPVSTIEHELVARLASLLWRLRRTSLIETNLFQLQRRIAKDQNLEARAGSDTASPELGNLFRLVRSPDTFVPLQATSNSLELTNHEADVPDARESSSSYSKPATIFLRLCTLSTLPIERINRYETALWRQVAQTLFIFDACKKRLPFPMPVAR